MSIIFLVDTILGVNHNRFKTVLIGRLRFAFENEVLESAIDNRALRGNADGRGRELNDVVDFRFVRHRVVIGVEREFPMANHCPVFACQAGKNHCSRFSERTCLNRKAPMQLRIGRFDVVECERELCELRGTVGKSALRRAVDRPSIETHRDGTD